MKKVNKILTLILLTILFIPSTVFADAGISNYFCHYDDIGLTNQTFYIGNEPYNTGKFVIHTITEDNNTDIAYCLHQSKGAPNNETGKINPRDYVLDEQGQRLSDSQLELIKNILANGYQKDDKINSLLKATQTKNYSKDDIDTANKIYATQILVWEVVEGVRTGYTNSDYTSSSSTTSLKFMDSNGKLKSFYDSILKNAAILASGNKPESFGKTYIMHWSDSTNNYSVSNINVSDYKIDSYDKNKISVSKNNNNVVTITSAKELTTAEKVTFSLTKGSTLNDADKLKIFVYNNNATAYQELALSNYRSVQTGELSVKTESGKFKITKQDSTTKKNLKGAVFELYKCNSNNNCSTKVATIDMKDKAVSSDITITKSGNYMLRETIAPAGYDKLDDVLMTLIIDDNGKVSVHTSSSIVKTQKDSSILNLILYNDQKVFKIKKIDGVSNKNLKGATFQIKTSDGTLVKFTKQKTGKYYYDKSGEVTDLVSPEISVHYISLLPVGEYILEETAVPSPYVLPSNLTERQTKFKIDEKNFLMVYDYEAKKYVKSADLTITVKNFKTRIIIRKTGLKNAAVEGVVFELYDSKKENQIPLTFADGEYTYDKNASALQLVTNSNGKIFINSLVSGTYYLKEISTPEGSGLVIDPNNEWTKITISIKRNKATTYNYTKEIRNAKGTFCFYKIDEDGNYLDSGKFKLQMYNEKTAKYDDKQLIFNSDKTYSIDKDEKSDLYVFSPISEGQTCFVDVDVKGKYRIVEIEAPEGFVLPSSSEAMAEIEINEYGYASGDAVIMNRKIIVGDGATAQAELIVNIQTGQNKVHYIIIISSIVAIIGALIIFKNKIDKK